MAAEGKRLEVALAFARQGCRIYPAQRSSNRPTEAGWRQTASTDESTIRAWWKRYDGTNYGALTDDTLVCVDIDQKSGKDGLAELARLEQLHGELPATHTDRTPSGGQHRFFKRPAGEALRTVNPLPGTEGLELHADGASAILAETFFPDGRSYETIANAFTFAELPAWLVELSKNGRLPPAEAPAEGDKRYTEGARDKEMYRDGCAMRGRGLSEDAIYQALVTMNETRCDPPLSDADVRRIAKSAARHRPNRDTTEVDAELHLTEDGLAHRLVAEHGKDIHYCWPLQRWFVWDGRRWKADEHGAIQHLARQTVMQLYAEAAGTEDGLKRKKLAKFALKSEARSKVEALIALARSLPGIPVAREEFDTDPWLLNCANGTVHLGTGELHEHRREDMITKLSNVEYKPDAAAPLWDNCLRTWLPDQDMREFVQVALGYSATGSKAEECFFVLHGSGRNGKSKMLDTVAHVLGDYSTVARAETFMKSRTDRIPEDVAVLEGVRFVQSGEIEEGRAWATGLLKQATGDEKTALRALRQDTRQGALVFKLWMGTNNLPTVSEQSDAIWERIIPIPFDVYIPMDDRDKFLLQKLKGEAEGILAWLVRGAITWSAQGLRIPLTILAARKTYRDAEDVLEEFIGSNIEGEAGARTNSRDILKLYNAWCKDAGEKPKSGKWLVNRMREKGFQAEPGRGGSKVYSGIKLVGTITAHSGDLVT